MRVSVTVCAYTMERWDSLRHAVESCQSQTRKPDEIIVVIDYNDLLFAKATREFSDARVVSNTFTKGLSGARNTGVAVSDGDVVVFLDDDAYAEPEWLEELVSPFVDPKVAGVGGWIIPEWEGPTPRWFPRSFYWILGCSYEGLPDSGESIRNPIGASMAIRREVFGLAGGFTSGLGRIGVVPLGCEETELCIRFNKHSPDNVFVLRRESIVHHYVPDSRTSLRYFWRRCWAEGLSKAVVASLVGSNAGYASERRHVLRTLPREFLSCLLELPRRPRTSVKRAILIASGTLVAAAGVVRGRLTLRRAPLEPPTASVIPGSPRPTASEVDTAANSEPTP